MVYMQTQSMFYFRKGSQNGHKMKLIYGLMISYKDKVSIQNIVRVSNGLVSVKFIRMCLEKSLFRIVRDEDDNDGTFMDYSSWKLPAERIV